jgi:2-hydroxy-3-keto-5-methylthiopentenyl-1-phosphate phosphatase
MADLSLDERSELAESIAELITLEQWSVLDADQQQALLELTSPMLVAKGITPEDLTSFFEHGRHKSLMDDTIDESGSVVEELMKRIVDVIIEGPSMEFTKHGDNRIAIHRSGVTFIANITESSDGRNRISNVVISSDVDSVMYKEAEQYKSKREIDMNTISWFNSDAQTSTNDDNNSHDDSMDSESYEEEESD